MSEPQQFNGRCLCGAVTVTASTDAPRLHACHCDMCRRQTSGMFISLTTIAGSVVFEGPTKTYRSSDWAERGFCEVCGSTLWYGTVHDGRLNPAAGLFDNLNDTPLTLELFAETCPAGYKFAGNHQKLSNSETIALFAPDEGDAS